MNDFYDLYINSCNVITAYLIDIVHILKRGKCVKRSRIFITVLFSLFMFQSMWNVAAAFCTHENSQPPQKTFHFGHHISSHVHSNESKSETKGAQTSTIKQNQNDDHSDHLPSFAHLLLLENRGAVQPHHSVFSNNKPYFDWHNFYQSPHLAFLNPPPNFTPL